MRQNTLERLTLGQTRCLGIVVIGRNEGERLITCLRSLPTLATIVYVDFNSTDGSVSAAQKLRANVIEMDVSIPFSAARARNEGFKRLLQLVPNLQCVQFVDGDCELRKEWVKTAVSFLECHNEVAAVCGRLRERYPERSVYNWLCDQEWNRPSGEVQSCAGNVMMRSEALHSIKGYREDVIAGEEEELCVRLREKNWRIWRIDEEMATHDAAMIYFAQWWKRSMRAGYAFAQGAYLHGTPPHFLGIWESCRALAWGFILPTMCIFFSFAYHSVGAILCLAYPLQLCRLTLKANGSRRDRLRISFFQLLGRFPEFRGYSQILLRLVIGEPTTHN